MKVLNQIKKFFNITFAIFTCVTLAMVTYNLLTVNVDHLVMATKIKVGSLYWQTMFFAAVTSLSVVIIDLFKRINGVIARILKFAFSYGAFAVWFFVMSIPATEGIVTNNVIIFASMIFVVAYTLTIVVKSFFVWLLLKLFGKEDDSYRSIFS
ncbi:MAG: hypothetical protein IKI97_03315 [Clostridia bacterium]|nr:hypothetical protein [Clostridia bacterium]